MGEDGRGTRKSPDVGLPLTERILIRLGRPRAGWIIAWSLVPIVEGLLFTSAIRLSVRPLDERVVEDALLTQAVLAYVVFVLLIGTGVLASQARRVADDVVNLVTRPLTPPLFHRIPGVGGPFVLVAVGLAVITLGGLLRYGPLPPLAALPLLTVYLVPILVFVWVYVAILVDIDRLGRQPLRLDAFPEDRTLGLGNVGTLASTGFALLLAAAVPVLLVGADEPVTLGIDIVIVGTGVVVFLLSMWRLHVQMTSAKARHVARSRALYEEAYAPLREHPTLEGLEARASALGIAEALDTRAHGLPTWPIDERTTRFVVVIITGVLTSLVVRTLFAALDA